MSAPQSTTETIKTVTWEIHVQMPDGTEGPAYFGASAEVYDDVKKATYYTDRYTSEQVGWKKPLDERKRYFLVEVITNTTRDQGIPVSQAEDGKGFCAEQITVRRRRVREGLSWYDEDGGLTAHAIAESANAEPADDTAANDSVPHTTTA